MLRKNQGAWIGQEKSLIPFRKHLHPTDARHQYRCDEQSQDATPHGEIGADVGLWRLYQYGHRLGYRPYRGRYKLRLVMQAFDNQGFVTTAERSHAGPPGFQSSGQYLDSVRRTANS